MRSNLVYLFITRIVRMYAYGLLAVILALYLAELGFSEVAIGLLLSLTLLGDTLVSLWITTHADRLGRRRMLIAGSFLMLLAGLVFVATDNYFIMLAAAIIGVISPSGYEVGPFLPIEQASLSQLVSDRHRTKIFGWYNLVGAFATALGALCGGVFLKFSRIPGTSPSPASGQSCWYTALLVWSWDYYSHGFPQKLKSLTWLPPQKFDLNLSWD